MAANRALLLSAALALLTGCHAGAGIEATEIQDEPETRVVSLGSIQEIAPAYGIAIGSGANQQFEVNIEAPDAPHVRDGQSAQVKLVSGAQSVPCRVSRVLRGVSAETGQAVAWLAPSAPGRIPAGEFVFATIITSVRSGVIAIPTQAILYKEGQSWVIRQEKDEKGNPAFRPVAVKTGVYSTSTVEITSGLSAGNTIIDRGGIGYLYPDFKASAEGD
jgi:hypothetical protein